VLAGGVVEKTFRAGEMLNVPDLAKREAQFTYAGTLSSLWVAVSHLGMLGVHMPAAGSLQANVH
jgi:hypothetical protein